MTRRHKARRGVLQILYAWEARGRDRPLEAEAADFWARRNVMSGAREYAERLVTALAEHLDEIDVLLGESSEGWEVERMSIVDRNILRIAVTEFLYVADVPSKVSIDEAVMLAARYGGADSPRFVNGVLDAIAHKLNLIAGR
ncbi:MAG: transcription antitermination factor NusB [Gemmatimonadota bacterium]